MENVWFFDDNEAMVSWEAILSPRVRHEDLLTWTQEVVRIGSATRVLVPVAIPRYQAFGADATDRLVRGLADRARAGMLDLLDFASFGDRHTGNQIHTRIAVADRGGVVREFMAARVAELPPSIWRNGKGVPDVDDEGMFFLNVNPCGLLTAERLADLAAHSREIAIGFSLHTNLWFPWIPGSTSKVGNFDHDNRPLATVHTPGLNAFLSQVKDLTQAMGGRWECEMLCHNKNMFHETGIDLQ